MPLNLTKNQPTTQGYDGSGITAGTPYGKGSRPVVESRITEITNFPSALAS